MSHINVMLSSRPKLLLEVMQNLIERQPNMNLVGKVLDPIELVFALRLTHVDVVIITPLKVNGEPKICNQLLKEHPQLKILILTKESEVVYVYQAGINRIRIEKPSEQTILDLILKTKEK